MELRLNDEDAIFNSIILIGKIITRIQFLIWKNCIHMIILPISVNDLKQ